MPLDTEARHRLGKLVKDAISLDNADHGSVQILERGTNSLRILVHTGLPREYIRYFAVVKPFDASSCGRALGLGGPVFLPDVLRDKALRPHRPIVKRSGLRAVKSFPVRGEDAKILGMASVYFREPRADGAPEGIDALLHKIAKVLKSWPADALKPSVIRTPARSSA